MKKKQYKELDRFATKYKKNMQLKTKLLLMVCGFILLSCFFVAGASLVIFNMKVEQVMMDGLVPTSDGVLHTLKNWRAGSDGFVAIYGRDKDIAYAVQNDHSMLEELMEDRIYDTTADFFAVTDTSGQMLWAHNISLKNVMSTHAVSKALRGEYAWSYEGFSDCDYALVSAAPIISESRIVGTIVLGYSFTNSLLVDQVAESYGTECTVFKGDLRVDTSLVDTNGNKLTGTKLANQAVIEQVLNGGNSFIGKTEIGGKKYVAVYVPLLSDSTEVTGMLFVAKSLESISKIVKAVTIILTPCAIVLAIIFSLFNLSFVSWLMWRIKNVTDSLEDMATGETDLSKRCKLFVRDEIGALIIHFDAFCDRLQKMVSEIKDTKGELLGYGERLGTMVQENTSFVDEMVHGIGNVKGELVNQHEKVGSTVNAVDGISNAVQQLHSLLQTQEQSVETASSAVTEMIGNIDSVSHSIEKMASEFDVLQGDVGNGIERQREVNKQIQNIEEQSKMLNEANAVISSIAAQTNLLAMNAAIEAAHAGDAGKGFAVVADEIRKLSENSSTQSKSIGNQLSAILDSISSVVHASDVSDKVFSGVSKKITDTGDLVRQIKLAMDEQSQGSKQIGEALSDMNDATGQVRSASDDVDKARHGIIDDVESMRQSSESVQASLENIEKGVKRIESGDDSLMNIATEISGTIYRINSQIDAFKA